MINEVLFEHVAPSFDDIEQALFEWPSINLEPEVKDLYSLYALHLLVDLLVRVNLSVVRNFIIFVYLSTIINVVMCLSANS